MLLEGQIAVIRWTKLDVRGEIQHYEWCKVCQANINMFLKLKKYGCSVYALLLQMVEKSTNVISDRRYFLLKAHLFKKDDPYVRHIQPVIGYSDTKQFKKNAFFFSFGILKLNWKGVILVCLGIEILGLDWRSRRRNRVIIVCWLFLLLLKRRLAEL